jgi:hypothetical protein
MPLPPNGSTACFSTAVLPPAVVAACDDVCMSPAPTTYSRHPEQQCGKKSANYICLIVIPSQCFIQVCFMLKALPAAA